MMARFNVGAFSKRGVILQPARIVLMQKLSGEHGDGLITDPMMWKQHKQEWQAGARAAGKDPGMMPVAVESFVVVGDQNDAQYAAKQWNFIPKAFKGYHNIPDPAEIERRAAAVPLPKVYGDWTVSSDAESHVKAIKELFDSGVTIVNIHSGQEDQAQSHRVLRHGSAARDCAIRRFSAEAVLRAAQIPSA